MKIQVHRAEYKDIESWRDLYRQEANCQIIHDSALRRNIADPYLILIDGRITGYGAVWNKHEIGRLMEFYTLPEVRREALSMYKELVNATKATSLEAQTNMPLMLMMFYDCAANITTESVLFQDSAATNLVCKGTFRPARTEDANALFSHQSEPEGDWVVEADGAVVATGGFLCHYNPPYGDIYMEVSESARRQGLGSYLVQELKRVCYQAGKKPAARCNPLNVASRRTLEKAGFLPCGRLLVGETSLS